MTETLLIILIVLSVIALALLVFLLLRKKNGQGGADGEALRRLEENNAALKDAMRRLEERTDAIGTLADYNARALESLNRTTETRLNNIQARLAEDIKYIVDVNAQNLERIRRTVDDKLTTSLDGKLSDSYARIAERLEKMYQSVGEMKSLSDGVADIRRVFTNVKLRGTWGEAQLDTLLAQMLAPEQYERSVKLNPFDNTLVDFAVVLPDRDGAPVYLPVDSKFPVEEFERLSQASAAGDREGTEKARKNLERAVKVQAESIAKKYIHPPRTTDFAIMFLPSEALYAEILSGAGLSDYLRARRVVPCGPTNLAALLSTLQTGFRTAAIEKRSGELREMLEAFRADFSKFAENLEKTRKKLQEAQAAVESTEKQTNTIGRRLDSFRAVGESSVLPPADDGV